MQPHHAIFILLLTVSCVAVFAGSDSQTVTLNVPKVSLFNVEPAVPFTFEAGQTSATGNSNLSVSSNDPQAKLYITPSGINLTVTSNTIQCPTAATTSTIQCHVGILQTQNSTLAFNATRTTGEPNIVYTLAQ